MKLQLYKMDPIRKMFECDYGMTINGNVEY